MLDSTTKRRIDDCRDILVGKLPDPKAQIEQITIGLIYKFMDDMDKENQELGGEAKFFTGDYAKYAWDNLINPKVTAAEMLKLYSEAIESMEKNANIPQLFRDIFNNAYLPYRDPETLKLFLKTIGEFEYTHSEKLGDAFEYLLSVMGSQGDAGQFRTPRHIIDFLVAIIDPKMGESVLDPACGTAGFLISAYKHVLLQNSSQNKDNFDIYEFNKQEKRPFNNLGDQMLPDDRKKLIKSIIGYDISPDMHRLSLVNLYLHNFTDPHIYEYDTLSREDRWDETYDVILANPPFMSPKGGIRPHKRFTIQSNRSEVLFVDYIAEHLNPNGRAGIIVPEGVIFQSGTAYKALRKMLVEDYLYGVISLPAGVFNPYSGVKTSILLMDKEVAKKSDEILFIKIDNDGYNLGAQRTAVKGSQLEEAIEVAKSFRKGNNSPLEEGKGGVAHTVPKTEIAKNGDYNLSGERYKELVLGTTEFDLYELNDLFEIKRGGSPRPIDEYITDDSSGINWIKIGDVEEGAKYITKTKQRIKKEGLKKSRLVEPGDFILSNSMSFGRPYIVNITGAIHDGWLVFKSKEDAKINNDFIFRILSSDFVKTQFAQSATGGVVKNLNIDLVRKVKIPLPPLSVQEEIVAEIEGYQKIIDGAKAVVDNYKPKIDIDPEWEMVELGEVCEITSSKRIFKEEYVDNGIPFYRTKEIVELSKGQQPSLELFISKVRYNEIKDKFSLPKKGDILLSAVGTLGISWIVDHEEPFYFKDGNLVWIKSIRGLESIFLQLVLDIFIPAQMHVLSAGAAYKALTIVKLKQLQIPVPSIEDQKKIVSQIEREKELVNANKQLIEIFEQKIKDRIGKVWGEEKDSNHAELGLASQAKKTLKQVQGDVRKVAEEGGKYGA